MGMVSPNDLLADAKKWALNGAEPAGREDWCLLFFYMARIIHKDVQPAALQLIGKLYDQPLSDEEIEKISILASLR